MNHKRFNYLLLFLFLVFITIYYSNNIGLVDYKAKYKKELTEKEIIQFEEDIKNNREIDINKYNDDYHKYRNGLSRLVLNVSNGIGDITKSIFDYLFSEIVNNNSN